MFLTRIGEDCKVVVNDDSKQSDIRGPNGLADAIERLSSLRSIYVQEFTCMSLRELILFVADWFATSLTVTSRNNTSFQRLTT